jgi:hypothetical protein
MEAKVKEENEKTLGGLKQEWGKDYDDKMEGARKAFAGLVLVILSDFKIVIFWLFRSTQLIIKTIQIVFIIRHFKCIFSLQLSISINDIINSTPFIGFNQKNTILKWKQKSKRKTRKLWASLSKNGVKIMTIKWKVLAIASFVKPTAPPSSKNWCSFDPLAKASNSFTVLATPISLPTSSATFSCLQRIRI